MDVSPSLEVEDLPLCRLFCCKEVLGDTHTYFCMPFRSLTTELEKARQEEELRLREESRQDLLKLQIQIQSDTAAEEERLRYQFEPVGSLTSDSGPVLD